MAKVHHRIYKWAIFSLLSFTWSTLADDAVLKKPLPSLTSVSVQLRWFHQFQFAGFYAALQQGYFSQAGLDVTLIEGGPTIDPVDSVLEGRADFGIGNSSLLVDFNKGRPVVAVAAIFQRDLKTNFYGDTLFTSQNFSQKHPEIVITVRKALIQGWQYALRHPEEMVSLIIEQYPSKKDRLALEFESQIVPPLLATDLVDIGFMSHNRWRHIGDTFVISGLMKENYRLEGFLFETEDTLPVWVYIVLLTGLLMFSLGGVTTVYILRINHRLRHSLVQINEQKNVIEHQASHDTLTGLPALRLARDRWDNAIGLAKRKQSRAAVLFIDLDDFKAVNDTFGHDTGDYVLKSVAHRLSKSIREIDTAARVGGDEFIVILNGINASDDASTVAEKLISAIQMPIEYNNYLINIGVSIGIGVYPDHASNASDLLRHADMSMYSAKKAGKDRQRPIHDAILKPALTAFAKGGR